MMRRGYFLRPWPQEPDVEWERFDAVCVPLECYRDGRDWIDALPAYLEVWVHLPACYLGRGYTGVPYDGLRDSLRMADASLGFDAELIDMPRDGVLMGQMLAGFVNAYRHPRVTGLFLDCVWDSVAWTGATIADDEWALGMRLFLTALRFRLGRAGWRGLRFVGNGWTHCPMLDGLCYEAWPQILGSSTGGNGSWHEAWSGEYGIERTGFDEYHFIPPSVGHPGEGVTDEDAVKVRAFAALVEAETGADTLVWMNGGE